MTLSLTVAKFDDVGFRLPAFASPRTEAALEIVQNRKLEIVTLANISALEVIGENDAAPAGCAVAVVNESLSVYLELRGALSTGEELEKISKRIDEIRKLQDKYSKMMNTSGYKEKVQPQVHDENVAKITSLMQEQLSLEEARQHIEAQI